MRHGRFLLVALAILLFSLGGCANDEPDETLTAFGSAYSGMISAMESASFISVSGVSGSGNLAMAGAINASWSSSYMSDPRCRESTTAHCSTGSISLKQYMGFMLDPNAEDDLGSGTSIFSKITESLMLGCLVMVLAGNGDGSYPANGTTSLTLTRPIIDKIAQNCSSDLDDAEGFTVRLTISDAGSAVYDKQFAMDYTGDGNADESSYLKYAAGSEITMASLENDDSTKRTILTYNFSTLQGRVEQISADVGCSSDCNGEAIRIFWDTNSSSPQAAIVQIQGSSSGGRNYFYASGQPGQDTRVGFSVYQTNYGTNAVGNACLSKGSGEIVEDNVAANASACSNSVGIVDIGAAGAAKSAADTYFGAGATSYLNSYWSTSLSSTSTPGFSGISDIATATYQ